MQDIKEKHYLLFELASTGNNNIETFFKDVKLFFIEDLATDPTFVYIGRK